MARVINVACVAADDDEAIRVTIADGWEIVSVADGVMWFKQEGYLAVGEAIEVWIGNKRKEWSIVEVGDEVDAESE